MAYEYTLTNQSQFKAGEFQETTSDIQLKNNGVVECNEIVESLEYKIKDSKTFLKIFYHYPRKSSYWSITDNLDNKSYLDFFKFSLLNILDNSFKDDAGNFEFILEWPLGDTEGMNVGAYFQWIQNKSPKEIGIDDDSNSYMSNYVDGNYFDDLPENKTIPFVGLRRAPTDYAYLDGDKGGDKWYSAIGSYREWEGGIPGLHLEKAFNDVKLWVKLPDTKLSEKGSFYLGNDKKIYCNEFIEE